MLLFQLMVNVGMVLGVMPITGIPLPFVTHGGASLISAALGLGILESIAMRTGVRPDARAGAGQRRLRRRRSSSVQLLAVLAARRVVRESHSR